MDAAAPTLAEPFLQTDHPCVRCGYSLRGLSPQGNCPECATPVDRSLRGDLLLYCDPEYARGLLLGARLVVASTYSFVILLIALGLGTGILEVNSYPTRGWIQAAELWLLLTWSVFSLGWWALTIPDAGQLTTHRGQRPRLIVRATLAASSAVIVCGLAIQTWGSPDRRIDAALALFNLIAVAIGFFASMLYVRWLASRIPSPRITTRAAALMKAIGVTVTLFLLAFTRADALVLLVAFGVFFTWMIVLSSYSTMFSWFKESLLAIRLRQAAAEAPRPESARPAPAPRAL